MDVRDRIVAVLSRLNGDQAILRDTFRSWLEVYYTWKGGVNRAKEHDCEIAKIRKELTDALDQKHTTSFESEPLTKHFQRQLFENQQLHTNCIQLDGQCETDKWDEARRMLSSIAQHRIDEECSLRLIRDQYSKAQFALESENAKLQATKVNYAEEKHGLEQVRSQYAKAEADIMESRGCRFQLRKLEKECIEAKGEFRSLSRKEIDMEDEVHTQELIRKGQVQEFEIQERNAVTTFSEEVAEHDERLKAARATRIEADQELGAVVFLHETKSRERHEAIAQKQAAKKAFAKIEFELAETCEQLECEQRTCAESAELAHFERQFCDKAVHETQCERQLCEQMEQQTIHATQTFCRRMLQERNEEEEEVASVAKHEKAVAEHLCEAYSRLKRLEENILAETIVCARAKLEAEEHFTAAQASFELVQVRPVAKAKASPRLSTANAKILSQGQSVGRSKSFAKATSKSSPAGPMRKSMSKGSRI